MSRRLKQAAKEKDQTKINKYAESITKKETLKLAESADSSNSNEDVLVIPISTGSPIPNKELVAFDTKQIASKAQGAQYQIRNWLHPQKGNGHRKLYHQTLIKKRR